MKLDFKKYLNKKQICIRKQAGIFSLRKKVRTQGKGTSHNLSFFFNRPIDIIKGLIVGLLHYLILRPCLEESHGFIF